MLPAILSGCELWALPHVQACISSRADPYKVPELSGLLRYLKGVAGLPAHSFNAAVYQVFGLPCLFAQVLPRIVRFLESTPLFLSQLISHEAAAGGLRCS